MKKDANFKNGLLPWVGNSPKVLILGTMPGDISLSAQTYYSNTSRNSFWRIMYSIYPKEENQGNKEYIISHQIALWDCIEIGYRSGSTDDGLEYNTLKPNSIRDFLKRYPTIRAIVLNGKGKGSKKNPSTPYLFNQFFGDLHHKYEIVLLPSTSNSLGMTFEEKLSEWSIVKTLIED
jgi:hypoxanthine-DNA glycosylase